MIQVKKWRIGLAIFFAVALINHASNNIEQSSLASSPAVVVVSVSGTTFFAVEPMQHKIFDDVPYKKITPEDILLRYNDQTDAWYANYCQENSVLHNLLSTFWQHAIKDLSTSVTDAKPKIVILDIDDTVITFYKSYQSIPADYNQVQVIQPIYDLYHKLLAHDIKIAFITNRSDSLQIREKTLKQLIDNGYDAYEKLYFRPKHWHGSASKYKEWARGQIAQDYEIIASFDDDWNNLVGKHVGKYAVWIPSLFEKKAGEEEFFQILQVASNT